MIMENSASWYSRVLNHFGLNISLDNRQFEKNPFSLPDLNLITKEKLGGEIIPRTSSSMFLWRGMLINFSLSFFIFWTYLSFFMASTPCYTLCRICRGHNSWFKTKDKLFLQRIFLRKFTVPNKPWKFLPLLICHSFDVCWVLTLLWWDQNYVSDLLL